MNGYAPSLKEVFERMDYRQLHASLIRLLNDRGVPAKSVEFVSTNYREPSLLRVTTWSGNMFHYSVTDAFTPTVDRFKRHLHSELDDCAAAYKSKHYPKTPLPFAEEPDSIPAENFLKKHFDKYAEGVQLGEQ